MSITLKEAMAHLSASGEAPSLESTALPPSKLGTKQHWDQVYEREVKTFNEIGDEGEVWFGEDSADKMVEWAEEHYPDTSAGILDIGTGNGQLLFAFAEAGYTRLVGVDYSESSTELAKSIAIARGLSPSDEGEAAAEKGSQGTSAPLFVTGDILSSEPIPHVNVTIEATPDGPRQLPLTWQLVTDKGTYDAVCLSDDKDKDDTSKRIGELYPGAISRLLAPGGIFLITSCNWTRKELERAFINEETGTFIQRDRATPCLEFHSHVPRPQFSFGGSSGSSIETVAFVKKP